MTRPVLVVPLDGSELAERALPYAVRLAAARGGQLALIRVALGPPLAGFDWERQQLAAVDEAEAYLSQVADTLAVQGLPILSSDGKKLPVRTFGMCRSSRPARVSNARERCPLR